MQYKFEGGVDFYAELAKLSSSGAGEVAGEAAAAGEAAGAGEGEAAGAGEGEAAGAEAPYELCNISCEPLVRHNVTLVCGHKFNYEPLYHEIKSQKKPRQGLAFPAKHSKLKLNVRQLKCPLCRNIQHFILPWIPLYTNCPKLYGVNTPKIYSMYLNKCNHILKYGKNKGEICDKQCNDEKCNLHMGKIPKEGAEYCPAIIKSGINKGKICGCAVKQNGFCNRHNK